MRTFRLVSIKNGEIEWVGTDLLELMEKGELFHPGAYTWQIPKEPLFVEHSPTYVLRLMSDKGTFVCFIEEVRP